MKLAIPSSLLFLALAACGTANNTSTLSGTSDDDAIVAHVRAEFKNGKAPSLYQLTMVNWSCVQVHARRGDTSEPAHHTLSWKQFGDFVTMRDGTNPVSTFVWTNNTLTLTNQSGDSFVRLAPDGDLIIEETCEAGDVCRMDNFEPSMSTEGGNNRYTRSYFYCPAQF